MRLKKNGAFILVMVVIGLAGLAAILQEVSIRSVFSTFINAKPSSVLLFLLSSAMVMATLTLRWKYILQTQGHNVPFKNLLAYRICGYGVSVVTPVAKAGGEPIRIMLLKRHKIDMKDRVFSVITDKVIELSANFLYFSAGMIILLLNFAVPGGTQVAIIVVLILFAILVSTYYARIMKGKDFFSKVFRVLRLNRLKSLSRFEHRLAEMEGIMIEYFRYNKNSVVYALLISFTSWVFTFLELKYALQIIGIREVSVPILFIILSILGLAFLIPIPLSLGSLEALQISGFSFMRFHSAASAVALSFMIRVRDLIWTAIAFIILSYYGFTFGKIIRKSLKRVDEEVTSVKVRGGRKVDIKLAK